MTKKRDSYNSLSLSLSLSLSHLVTSMTSSTTALTVLVRSTHVRHWHGKVWVNVSGGWLPVALEQGGLGGGRGTCPRLRASRTTGEVGSDTRGGATLG